MDLPAINRRARQGATKKEKKEERKSQQKLCAQQPRERKKLFAHIYLLESREMVKVNMIVSSKKIVPARQAKEMSCSKENKRQNSKRKWNQVIARTYAEVSAKQEDNVQLCLAVRLLKLVKLCLSMFSLAVSVLQTRLFNRS